jgi:hypothetical protein
MPAAKGRDKRTGARIPLKERASLNAGDDWFPCMVQDMSDGGFHIMCSKELSVGQVLDFRFELFPEKTLNCKVEVRHVGPSGMGTKVVTIDNRGSRLMELYLQEQYSLKLNSKS